METTPVVSVVSAVYNVSRYLSEFFDSLHAQTFDHQLIEIILVDDGSTDDSLELCRAFAKTWPGPARVLTKSNGGQASARNLGMDVAIGTWLSFADPDDMLGLDYVERMVEFASRPESRDVAVHVATMNPYDEATGEAWTHPLSFRFTDQDRLVDLDEQPTHIHLHVSQSLVRAAAVRKSGVRFEERLRSNFEDALFVAELILEQPVPLIGYVSSASYRYRRRAGQDSAVDLAKYDRRRFTEVLRFGHLGILRRAHAIALGRDSGPAQWAQNVVLYDLLWILQDSQTKEMQSVDFPEELHAEFIELLDQVLACLSNEAIAGFDVMRVQWWCLPALLMRKNGRTHTAPWRGIEDPGRGLSSVRYLHSGTLPAECLAVGGQRVEPRYSRELVCTVLNRPFVWEREIWTSDVGERRIWLDDVEQTIWSWHMPIMDEFLWAHRFQPSPTTQSPTDEARRLSRADRRAARRHNDAWVVMDRDTAANDCGEIFYKWLKKNHPEVNAYFVIRKDVPDWRRLRAEGIKPVAHGSRRWKALMLHARHMISSQIDDYVVNPLPIDVYGPRDWIFTFLQHGVTKDNIFHWFNQKRIDVLVASTQAEYDYCAGPGPSKLGNREVRLTGMPRFDDLMAQAADVADQEHDYLLVAPTWRDYLSGATIRGNERALNADFMQTAYARAWNELLRSPDLKTAADAAGVTVAFMPHPNIQPYLGLFELPDHVKVLRHADVDIRGVLARSRMMITDYSSIAFDMAYLYRHVVYYQFDHAEFFSGGHVFIKGYFDYRHDGFGPVAKSLPEVLKSVDSVLAGTVDERYADRMRQTFPVRDGGNCERTYEAIVAAETVQSFEEAAVSAPFETWGSVCRGAVQI